MARYGWEWLGMAGCELENERHLYHITNQCLYMPIRTQPHLGSSEP